GRGLAGTAFRTAVPAVCHDFGDDERFASWREQTLAMGVKSGAAIPLRADGRVIGVFALFAAEKHAFDEEVVRLLERMADNIVFAIANFEREAERKRTEHRIQYLATHDALTDRKSVV